MADPNEKIIVTPERVAVLKTELYQLINVERAKVTSDIKAAREQGDLSENADYEAARERQAQIESRILQIQNILDHASTTHIVKEVHNKVKIGDKIKIHHYQTDQELTVQILGRLDADPFRGVVSNDSPLAQAVLGHQIGSTVPVHGPKATFQVKILAIL